MKDAETRLSARAMLVLLAVAILLSGFLLWRQIASRVLTGAAAIQVAKNPEIRLIDHRAFPTCQKTDQYAGLQRRLARAMALDPGNRAAWQYLVKVRWASGDCAAVEAMLASGPAIENPSLALIAALLDIQSDRFQGRANYPQAAEIGQLFAQAGKDAMEADLEAEAVKWYEAAFLFAPTVTTADWLATYYTAKADTQRIQWVWEYLAQEKAGSDDGWWAKFHLAELSNDLDGKITALESGAESSDDPYQFLIELGWVYRQEKLYADALIVYERAEKLNREVVWPVISQGQVYLDIGDLEKAQERLKLAQSIDPANPFSYFYLGVAYDGMGDEEAAIAQVEAAVEISLQSEINPWTISEVLGKLYQKAGRCEDAKEAYEQALEWQPNEARLIEAIQNMSTCSK